MCNEQIQETAPEGGIEERIKSLDRAWPFNRAEIPEEFFPYEGPFVSQIKKDIKNFAFFTRDPEIIGKMFRNLFEVSENDGHYDYVALGIMDELIIQKNLFEDPQIATASVENLAAVQNNKGGEKEEYIWKMLQKIDTKNKLGEVMDNVFINWMNRQEYLRSDENNNGAIISVFLENCDCYENTDSVIDLQKSIILNGHGLLAEAVESGTFEESNIKRVVTGMLHSVNDKFQIDSFSDEELVKLISLYKLFKKEKIVGELNNLEKLLE